MGGFGICAGRFGYAGRGGDGGGLGMCGGGFVSGWFCVLSRGSLVLCLVYRYYYHLWF